MTGKNLSSENPTPQLVKKPYEKPTFRFEQVFVTTALTCGKVGGASMACQTNAQAS